jgi:membrane-associated phospholipid phosphatase
MLILFHKQAVMRLKVVSVLVFLFISKLSLAQNIDVSILQSIYDGQTSFKDKFFKADAQSVAVINIAAPVGIFAAGLIQHNKQLEKDAIFIGGAYIVSTIITQATKAIVKRDRPFVTHPDLFTDRYDGGGYSFPSSHTSSAFCTATSLSLYFPKWYVIAPSYLWAASIGWARMYEGVHYPSDVLTGAIVGAGSAWFGYKAQQWYDKKNAAKKTAVAFAW